MVEVGKGRVESLGSLDRSKDCPLQISRLWNREYFGVILSLAQNPIHDHAPSAIAGRLGEHAQKLGSRT